MNDFEKISTYANSPAFKAALQIPAAAVVTLHPLAQGEYNYNLRFTHPVTGRELVLRINYGSQMHLPDQIAYEYRALRQLAPSGRTPGVHYVDDSRRDFEQGLLVMDFLPGRPLDYVTDLPAAAACLADIHSLRLPRPEELRSPDNGLAAVLQESNEMFAVYEAWAERDRTAARRIRHMLQLMAERVGDRDSLQSHYRCCINTELNNTNFLINGAGERDYLIDWEKPLLGSPAQDLGHFLAPTTTFWKTDMILTPAQVADFIERYLAAVGPRFDTRGLAADTYLYLPVTCMRGITWCAMAQVQYQDPGKALVNESTRRKLTEYLGDEFLTLLEGYCG